MFGTYLDVLILAAWWRRPPVELISLIEFGSVCGFCVTFIDIVMYVPCEHSDRMVHIFCLKWVPASLFLVFREIQGEADMHCFETNSLG